MATVATTATTGQTGAGGGNTIRITGMASGLDVDSLVTKMLSSDQIKIDDANKANTLVQWKKDAYTSIIAGINSLQTSFFDPASSSTSMLSSTAYSSLDVSGIGATAADSTAQAGAYGISFTKPDLDPNGLDPKTGNLAATATIANTTDSALMTTDAPPVKATNATTLANIGFASNHNMTINYTNSDGSAGTSEVIAITPSMTLAQLTSAINTVTGNGVTARFSELTGQLSIGTSETGGKSTISILTDDGVLSKLNLGTATAWGTTSATAIGKDANVYITPPGGIIGKLATNSSNNFTIDGVSYGLTTAKDSTFNVTTSAQKVYDKINTFLTAYNTVVDQIQTAINAKTNSDYPPLTTAQQTAMTATAITNWNAKAQVGVLANDTNLTKMLTDLRSAFTSAVAGTGLTFGQHGTSAIGIDTSTDVTQGGKMTIVDKTDLMNAITNHPDQVQQFFAATSTATDKATNFSEKGVFSRISDVITANIGMIGTSINTATLTQFANTQDNYSTTGGVGKNTLPDQLYYQQQLVTQLNASMAKDSTKYYNQFSALEVAMSNMSAQMTMLSNYTG